MDFYLKKNYRSLITNLSHITDPFNNLTKLTPLTYIFQFRRYY